jgi:hypothetical protein
MEGIARWSPVAKARLAGFFYLITIVARIIGDGFIRDRLVRSNDAVATAANILSHQTLFRLGFVADLAAFASFLVLTVVFYDLFKPVSRSLSLGGAVFSVAACTVQAVSSVFHLAALTLLGGSGALNGFTTEQVQSLALMSLRVRAITYHNVGLVFFGLYLALIGYLILRSRFLPRVLGLLMLLAGLAYLTFLFPPLVRQLLPYILVPAAAGQISMTLWLLVRGVNAIRWVEQAAPTRASCDSTAESIISDALPAR